MFSRMSNVKVDGEQDLVSLKKVIHAWNNIDDNINDYSFLVGLLFNGLF